MIPSQPRLLTWCSPYLVSSGGKCMHSVVKVKKKKKNDSHVSIKYPNKHALTAVKLCDSKCSVCP